MYQDRLDEILTYFHQRFPEAMAKARVEYFNLTGEVFEDDPFYEDRLTQYLEWFLYNGNLSGRTPIRHYLEEEGPKLSEEDRVTIEAFTHPRHSLFEVMKLKPKEQAIILMDLATREKLVVTERRTLVGLAKGNLFETRLFEARGQLYFMSAFVHHPDMAASFIRKRMKRMRKEGVTDFVPFLIALQRLWMQSQRYRHVSPKKIYSEENLQRRHAL